MLPVQREKTRLYNLTLLLVVPMPNACWFLWRADHIEDFKWRFFTSNLGSRSENWFWERYYILEGQITFEGHRRLQSWTPPPTHTPPTSPLFLEGAHHTIGCLLMLSHVLDKPNFCPCKLHTYLNPNLDKKREERDHIIKEGPHSLPLMMMTHEVDPTSIFNVFFRVF